MCQGALPRIRIDDANGYPDDAGGDQHRLGFAQLQVLFGHHQEIGEHEDDEGEEADAGVRQGKGAAIGQGRAAEQAEPGQGGKA
ncbi:hypothetical protein D3C85_1307740 [compost metagenome]